LKQSHSSKKTKSSNSELNKADYHINRGFEISIKGGKREQHRPVTDGSKEVTFEINTLVLFALPVSFLILLVGLLMGWVARDYMMNYREVPRPHPEMFDSNGNLVPDEVIAFRFENNYDDDEEDDD